MFGRISSTAGTMLCLLTARLSFPSPATTLRRGILPRSNSDYSPLPNANSLRSSASHPMERKSLLVGILRLRSATCAQVLLNTDFSIVMVMLTSLSVQRGGGRNAGIQEDSPLGSRKSRRRSDARFRCRWRY